MQQREVIGEVDRNPAVAIAQWLEADPDDLAGRAERVEIGWLVVLDARREDLALENRRGHGEALQRFDDFENRVESMPASHDALPVREEPRQHGLIDWLRFLAQFRERAAADRAKD